MTEEETFKDICSDDIIKYNFVADPNCIRDTDYLCYNLLSKFKKILMIKDITISYNDIKYRDLLKQFVKILKFVIIEKRNKLEEDTNFDYYNLTNDYIIELSRFDPIRGFFMYNIIYKKILLSNDYRKSVYHIFYMKVVFITIDY
jgi:hypothetical protein